MGDVAKRNAVRLGARSVRSAMRSGVVALGVITALVVSGGGAAAAASPALDAVVPAAAPVGDFDTTVCDLPPSMLGQTSSADEREVGAPEVADGDSLTSDLVQFGLSIVSNFAGDVATDGAGWVLNLLLGNDIGGNTTDVDTVLAQQQTDFNALQGELSALQTSLASDMQALEQTEHWGAYVDALQSADDTIGQMQTAVQDVCVFSLSTDLQTSEVTNVLQGIATATTSPLNDLDGHLMGTNGDDGLIAAYSQVVWDSLTPNTSTVPDPQLLNSVYLQKMQTFVNYFFGLSVQYMNAYTESLHWQSTATVPDSTVNLLDVFYQQLAGDSDATPPLQGDVNAWAAQGYDSIVSIPDGYLVDLRSMTAWSSPITLPSSNSDEYCLVVSSPCVAALWQSDDATMASTTLVPSVVSVASQMEVEYPQWSVPTVADWNALLASGSGGSDPANGVATWAVANQFSPLQGETVSVPTGQVTTVAPVLVSDSGIDVVLYTAQAGSTKTATTGAYAGQLVLVSPVGTNTPIAQQPDIFATDQVDAAALVAASPAGQGPDARARSAASVAAQGTTGTLDSPTTFTAAQSCTGNGYVQPAGANAVQVVVTGGSGGNGNDYSRSTNSGGLAGQVTATIPLSAGASLYVQVGGNGGTPYYSGDDGGGEGTWNPGGGGFGGGAAGGVIVELQDADDKPGAGGGGGGFSGVTADASCGQWLVIAGGGGGAGGIDAHNANSNGGNACVSSGCAGDTPTQTDGDTGAGTGANLITPGSAGEHDGNYAGNGTAGSLLAGGTGGDGGNSSTNPFHDWGGGSGGGGGGGWGGGGGGGGSTGDYAGAGGGGGGSYLAAGIATGSFSTAPSGSSPSVSITPVVSPEYAVTQTDGHIWDNADGAATDGNPILSAGSADGTSDQQWALLSMPSAPIGDSYQIVNPATSMCASSAGSTLALATCVDVSGSTTSGQAWTFVDAAGAFAVTTDTGAAALGAAGNLVPITIGPFEAVDNSTWNLSLASSSIWSPLGSSSVLLDPDLEDGDDPDEPPASPAPGAAPTPGAGDDRLAATGIDLSALGVPGAAGLMVVVLGGLLWLVARRLRRSA